MIKEMKLSNNMRWICPKRVVCPTKCMAIWTGQYEIWQSLMNIGAPRHLIFNWYDQTSHSFSMFLGIWHTRLVMGRVVGVGSKLYIPWMFLRSHHWLTIHGDSNGNSSQQCPGESPSPRRKRPLGCWNHSIIWHREWYVHWKHQLLNAASKGLPYC